MTQIGGQIGRECMDELLSDVLKRTPEARELGVEHVVRLAVQHAVDILFESGEGE